jgi:putative ABC transport system ATP-binding protein
LHNQELITAVDNISFEVNKNELVLLKGKSGSGKSTILSLIAALSKPTKGTIFINNTQISKLPDSFASEFRNKHIGFIFQKFNLINDLDVKENVLLPLIPQNLDKNLIEQKISKALNLAKISHKQNQLIKKLSGGEQQRVAIARALVTEPNLILADEPTANLDPNLTKNFIEILKDLKKLNKTIILATHDEVFFDLDIVDKIVELEYGKIINVIKS